MFAVVLSLPAWCQFQVFETLDDFVNGTPKDYAEFEFVKAKGITDVQITIRKKSTKEEFVIDCSRVWGFTYKGNLLRNLSANKYGYDQFLGRPMLLWWDGDICKWLNGTTVYTMAGSESSEAQGVPSSSVPFFFSRTVTGDMVPMVEKFTEDKATITVLDKFFEDNADLHWLRDCVREKQKKGYGYVSLRQCLDNAIYTGLIKMKVTR